MADPRETARRLLTLALDAGTGEHEARTAAMRACQLIQKYGLLEVRAPPPSTIDEFFDELFRSPARPPQPFSARRAADPEAQPVVVTQAVWCAGCAERLPSGAEATWSRGEVWHPDCYQSATQ